MGLRVDLYPELASVPLNPVTLRAAMASKELALKILCTNKSFKVSKIIVHVNRIVSRQTRNYGTVSTTDFRGWQLRRSRIPISLPPQ